jgi:uncharacterized protein with HEPN domain
MPRDARAYFVDIIESCDAIEAAIKGYTLTSYQGSRLIRSAVEREFIIIGEAIMTLHRVTPELYAAIGHARRIVDFRNQLTHEYPNVDDAIVWAVAGRDVPILRRECEAIMTSLESRGDAN